MPNNNLPRLHLKNSIDAAELRIQPGSWPLTITYKGSMFKRNLSKRSMNSGEIMWYNYHSNTKEHFWVLKVWNV